MTIRLRYHLALLPLFLGLTVASLSLYYIVQTDEISWGLDERSQGRALCLAAFLERPAGGGAPIADAARQAALARFAEAAGGLNVRWFVRDSEGWRGEPLLESPGLNPPPPPTDHVLVKLLHGQPAARRVSRPESEFDESIGYAAIGRDDVIEAVVAVTEKDTVARGELRAFVRIGAPFAATVLLSGFVVAELLVRRARRDVAALSAGASALASGDYSHPWRASTIRELDDLASTLQSIGAILQDGIRRTRRRFLRAEQMPGEEDVAAAYRRRCTATSAPGPDSGPPCAIRHVGRPAPDDFWGVRRTPTAWHVAVGRLQPLEENAPLLQRIVRAHAARDHLLGLLDERAPGDVWTEFDAVFRADCGESVSINHANRVAVAATHGAERRAVAPAADVPNVVGTLSPASMDFAREYLRQFPHRRLDALGDEIAALLAERDSGVLVIFQPSSHLS